MNTSTFLRTSLLGVVMLLPFTASAATPDTLREAQSAQNEQVDGKLVWLKTTGEKYDYAEAKKHCAELATSNRAWRIPTGDELRGFYKRIILTNELNGKNWFLGDVWLSDEGADANYHAYANIDKDKGTLYWKGTNIASATSVICVAQAIPNDVTSGNYTDMEGVTWSKITQDNSGKFEEAETYCLRMNKGNQDRPWHIPTSQQLVNFYERIINFEKPDNKVKNFPKQFKDNGWKLGFTWSSTEVPGEESSHYNVFMDQSTYPVGGSKLPNVNRSPNLFACIRDAVK